MPSTWTFFTAGQLIFGSGAVARLGEWASRHQHRRTLLVTDGALVQAGWVEKTAEPLRQAGVSVEVFDGGEPEPSIEAANRAIEFGRRFEPDSVLGLGGGSNMDLAKVVTVVLAHGGAVADYFGFDKVPGPVRPLLCVPTTAGTGSEVSHSAVLTDTAQQIKISMQSNYLRPSLAVVDPQLTVTCPPQVTADSGIDALTHAIECRTVVDFDKLEVPDGEVCAYEGRYPLGECLADKAISLIGEHLAAAVHEPNNLAAREGMALAATIAGMAFSNCGVSLVHALEYPLGGALHCSHGAGNGLLLPYVMRYNLAERKETFAHIAGLLGEPVQDLSMDEAAQRAIDAVFRLRREIGIPDRIRELGGGEDQLAGFAAKSFAIQRLMWLNPRRPTEEDLLEILQSAF